MAVSVVNTGQSKTDTHTHATITGREATAGIADIFKRDETALASGPTPRFLKLHHPIQDMPTPTPTPPVALHKRADSDEDEDDNTTEVTLEIKPHTTVDFDFEEVPILGDILSFIA